MKSHNLQCVNGEGQELESGNGENVKNMLKWLFSNFAKS